MFDPKTEKFPYPMETDKHYLEVHKDRKIVFDTKYPYIDRSPFFRFKQGFARFLLHILVFPVATVRMGLRIEGKENLKKNRELLKNGALSVANHVHMWDYIAVMKAIRPFRSNLLVWAPNVNGENGTLIRMVGGIPIPDSNAAAMKSFIRAVNGLLVDDHGWLHIYSEGSMWEYYAPVRPFKRGASHIACDCDKPVLPLAFSYREPGRIRKNIFRQIATFTLTIGEPLMPDKSLNPKEREKDLTIRCHDAVCRLAGIDPKDNLYPAEFKDSRRVDYYTSTYGAGYKGSH